MRRDDGCDSGKGLALLLHEDEDKIDEPDILPGITFDVFIKTLLAFRRGHENEEPPTDHRRYSILVKEVDLASLFNMIQKKQCSKYLHELMECTDFERLLEIINTLSLITSADRESADLVDSDTAKYLLEIVSYYEDDDIQCQAVYILSQVSIDKCYDVMANDVIPVLVKLMSHSFYHLGIAAVIALTRIANTSPGCIKVIVNKGGLEAALITAKECRDKQMIICCLAKFLAVVCRSYEPPLDKVEVVVTISEEFFQNKLNSDYHKVQACHTLQYLTYGRDVEIGEKLLHKLVGSIYKFLRVEDTLLASSALGVVGNIARWGNPDTIQVLTLNSVLLLSCLEDIMRWCEFKKFRMEACQIISNIASNIAARSGTLTKLQLPRRVSRIPGLQQMVPPI